MSEVAYDRCTTKFYTISAEDYLQIMEEANKENTGEEENKKLSKMELYELFLPFFTAPKNKPQTKCCDKISLNIPRFKISTRYFELIDDDMYSWQCSNNEQPTYALSAKNVLKGAALYKFIEQRLYEILWGTETAKETKNKNSAMEGIKQFLHAIPCKYIRLDTIITIFSDYYGEKLIDKNAIKNLYIQEGGIIS